MRPAGGYLGGDETALGAGDLDEVTDGGVQSGHE